MRRLLALTLLLSAGCTADFVEAWEVAEPRLMGARVEVDSDPQNPRPRLGQPFALRQFLALPGPLNTPVESRYSLALSLCLGLKASDGTLTCLAEQELAPQITVVSETELLLSGLNLDLTTIELPPELLDGGALETLPEEELRELDRVVLFGALCVDGRTERVAGKTARNDPPSQLFRCVPNEGAPFPDVSTFSLSVLLDLGRPEDRNANPNFACDPAAPDSPCAVGVPIEGEPQVGGAFVLARGEPEERSVPREVVAWPDRGPASALPWEGCASDPSLLQVRAGSEEHEVRVRLDPSDREHYQRQIEENGEPTLREARERLVLSHAISTKGGELESYDSLLDDEEVDARAEISFGYTPPKISENAEDRIPENGRLVRFYFTLRDQRGGADYATRELCLLPGEPEE